MMTPLQTQAARDREAVAARWRQFASAPVSALAEMLSSRAESPGRILLQLRAEIAGGRLASDDIHTSPYASERQKRRNWSSAREWPLRLARTRYTRRSAPGGSPTPSDPVARAV